MRTSRIGALGLCFAVLAAGCATSQAGQSYAEAKPTEARTDAALVYVMRFRAEPHAATATVLVDGTEVTDLPDAGFTWFYLPPGRHEIHARWGPVTGQHPASIALDLEAGQTYHLELTGVSQTTGHGTTVASWLEQRSAFAIEPKLSSCNYQKPRSTWPGQ
jgi:hypothetical protein